MTKAECHVLNQRTFFTRVDIGASSYNCTLRKSIVVCRRDAVNEMRHSVFYCDQNIQYRVCLMPKFNGLIYHFFTRFL